MTNQEIKSRLLELADEKYKDFSGSLVPGARPMIGVRIPAQRSLAKEIAKGDWKTYLEHAKDDTFEEVNLQGFVIGYAKADFETLRPYIEAYVEKIHDWSLCDGFCATLKGIRKYPAEGMELIRYYAGFDSEFKQRVAAVLLMDYYLTDAYIEETLQILDSLKHEGYYCKMGVAWAIATAFAKQRDKTLAYMQPGNHSLDDWTYNKAIQKMLESYRISDEDKNMLRTMK